MHSTHWNFSRNLGLQVATLPRVCFLLHLLQSFCHLLKILSKSLYCVAMKQQIRGEKGKPQKGKPIILVCGFETCLHVLIFIVNGHFTIWQHSWNFSGDHGFLHLTVKGIASETEKKKSTDIVEEGGIVFRTKTSCWLRYDYWYKKLYRFQWVLSAQLFVSYLAHPTMAVALSNSPVRICHGLWIEAPVVLIYMYCTSWTPSTFIIQEPGWPKIWNKSFFCSNFLKSIYKNISVLWRRTSKFTWSVLQVFLLLSWYIMKYLIGLQIFCKEYM